MLDLFLNLIDRFRGLVEYRKRQDERFFDELVSPLFSMFKEIHDDYLRILHDVEQDFASTLPLAGLPQPFIASVTTATLLKNYEAKHFYREEDERRLFSDMAGEILKTFREIATEDAESVALRDKLLSLRAELERSRLAHESTRVQLRTAVEELPRSSLPLPMHEFFECLVEYFQIGTTLYRRESYQSSSAASGLVRGIRELEDDLNRGLWGPDHVAYVWSTLAAELAYVNHEHRRQWGKACAVFERLRLQMKAANAI